ncbi:protein tolkin-like isoform X2 [Bemisia tabaci]|uniref:protein tolkin-like isoform X2 n=1 Tax=Bemisia tabaci TaxID=7038 RepID=UPI003B27C815
MRWISLVLTLMFIIKVLTDNPDPFHKEYLQISEPEDEFKVTGTGAFHEVLTKEVLSKKRLKNARGLWPMAVIVFKIDEGVGCPSSSKCNMALKVMAYYEATTCIRFKEWTGETDYVTLIDWEDPLACLANVGRLGGEQWVLLPSSCWNEGILLHEFGHVLGFWDEHNRYDRDKYIRVLFDNIKPAAHPFFDKAPKNLINILGEHMDFDSIMMYTMYAFAKDRKSPSFEPVETGKVIMDIWKKNKLSAGDIRRITKMYRCKGKNQKPRFPLNVICSFDDNPCGFKGAGTDENKKAWSWTPKRRDTETRQLIGGYLYSDIGTARHDDAFAWTINFHSVSPLDKYRSKFGCVSFSYVVLVDYRVTLKLTFKSKFEDKTATGSIWLDDFELKYAPCLNPMSIASEVDHQKSRREVPKSILMQILERVDRFYRDRDSNSRRSSLLRYWSRASSRP